MSAAEVKAAWGEPTSVREYPSELRNSEVWNYRRVVGQRNNALVTGTETVPEFQGPGRDMVMVEKPLYGYQLTEIVRVDELLLVGGILVEMKTVTGERSVRKD